MCRNKQNAPVIDGRATVFLIEGTEWLPLVSSRKT